jgi:Ankyrin repeats (3 copies)
VAAGGATTVTARHCKDAATPLHLALGKGQSTELVRFLLQSGADVNASKANGVTPLMLARELSTVRMLLEAGADVNVKNNRGSTALHVAVRYGLNAGIICCLLRAGADATTTSAEGLDAAALSALSSHKATAALLQRAAADQTLKKQQQQQQQQQQLCAVKVDGASSGAAGIDSNTGHARSAEASSKTTVPARAAVVPASASAQAENASKTTTVPAASEVVSSPHVRCTTAKPSEQMTATTADAATSIDATDVTVTATTSAVTTTNAAAGIAATIRVPAPADGIQGHRIVGKTAAAVDSKASSQQPAVTDLAATPKAAEAKESTPFDPDKVMILGGNWTCLGCLHRQNDMTDAYCQCCSAPVRSLLGGGQSRQAKSSRSTAADTDKHAAAGTDSAQTSSSTSSSSTNSSGTSSSGTSSSIGTKAVKQPKAAAAAAAAPNNWRCAERDLPVRNRACRRRC